VSEKKDHTQSDLPVDSREVATYLNSASTYQDNAVGQPADLSFRPTSAYPAEVTPAADADLTKAEDADEVAPVPPPPPGKTFWREVLETVLLTIMIFFLVKGLVANFRIQGSSMEPSFHTNQLVLVNKAAYFHFDLNSWARLIPGVHPQNQNSVWLFGGPKRGDVIIFEPPDIQDEDYIKRVIGLPGDKVEVKDGVVYVNDTPLNEPYIKEAPFSPYNAVVVPPNNLFVMGDNRNASRDSRSFNMLPVDKIVGKAMVVYWPFGDKWGIVPEAKYTK
jgi:signal peptidase I